MNPATTPEPVRDLNASFNQRTTGSRVEFAQWREANPEFTHALLMANWHRIRVAWGLVKSEPQRASR